MSAADFYDRPALIVELQRDEGIRTALYIDSTGHASIGVGRNLSAIGVSGDEIALMRDNDIARAVVALDSLAPWWRSLDPVRARVLLNMAFNLGAHSLGGFVHFLAAMQADQWQAAVASMRSSLWASQVGARATRLEAMTLTGVV